MKSMLTTFFFLILLLGAGAQPTAVQTKITAENNYDLSVIQVYPDSFPQVSVVFQARNQLGQPLWNLEEGDLGISENDMDCPLVGLKNISKNRALNIALVFDHSGSMVNNPAQMEAGITSYEQLYNWGMLPAGYTMPIDLAKEAVLNFLGGESREMDQVLFVGFSSTVDPIQPLTSQKGFNKKTIARLTPGGGTAFYDAIYAAIDSLKEHSEKPAVVALTDGQDNQSVHSYQEVIDFANEQEVPVYIIGLGSVHRSTLKRLAEATNGFFYHTSDPEALSEIYLNIQRQLKSIYELSYTSVIMDYSDPNADLKMEFANDTMAFANPDFDYELPSEVVDYLIAKAEARALAEQEQTRNRALAGMASVMLLGTGGFLVKRQKEKNEKKGVLALANAYPNPFKDYLKVEFSLPADTTQATLIMVDAKSRKRRALELDVTATEATVNTSGFVAGTYVVQIRTGNGISNAMRVVRI